MTDRERRQQRLLAVRTIQADLAAVELRRLRFEQEAASASLQELRGFSGTAVAHLGGSVAEHPGWLLACAEQEIAGMFAGRLQNEMKERAQQVLAQAAEEQRARQQREQMRHICHRTAIETRTAEDHRIQSRLDDLFSAGRVRSRKLQAN